MRQRHSALVLVILKRPGLKSFDTIKTILKLPERYWYNVRLHVEHISDGKKGRRISLFEFTNSSMSASSDGLAFFELSANKWPKREDNNPGEKA